MLSGMAATKISVRNRPNFLVNGIFFRIEIQGQLSSAYYSFFCGVKTNPRYGAGGSAGAPGSAGAGSSVGAPGSGGTSG